MIARDVMISLGLMTGAELEHSGDVTLPRPSFPESETSMLAEASLLMESAASEIKIP